MINQQFTFALHIMTALAFSGRVLDSKTLAVSVNTNPVVVRRLLQSLCRAGLIETYTGKNGGAKLLKRADRISLLDIYAAVNSRPLLAVNERKASRRCRVSCNMKKIMTAVAESAEESVQAHLRGIALAQIVRQVR
jgi:Rrf2 family protein